MACNIEVPTLADAAALSRNNVAAFWAIPYTRGGWSADVTLEALIKQDIYRIKDVLIYKQQIIRHLKAVDPNTGELMGYLRFALPQEQATASDGTPLWPDFQVAPVSDEERKTIEDDAESKIQLRASPSDVDERSSARQKEILTDRVCMKLRYLAVHPDHQRKGIAKALIKEVTKRSDETGLDVYCMAYDSGRPVYEKAGFQEIDRVLKKDAEDHGHNTCFMMYYPKKN